MPMALEVMKLIFAVLDVSFNSGHYTVIIKRHFLYINNRKHRGVAGVVFVRNLADIFTNHKIMYSSHWSPVRR